MRIGGIKRFLQRQDGYSLTEVMVGGAILAGLGLAGAQLFKGQKVAQKKVEHDQKLAIFHAHLTKTMNLTANCNATMKNIIPANSGLTGAPINVTRLYSCVPGPSNKCADDNSVSDQSFDAYTAGAYGGTSLIGVNEYIDESLVWQVIRMQILDNRTTTGTTRLRISYRMNPKIPAGKTVNKDIFLNLRFNSGRFRECINNQESNINNLQNDLCKTLNNSEGVVSSDGRIAVWDDVTQTCKVVGTKDCQGQYNMQVDGLGPDGVVRCKPILNDTDAQDIQDTTTVTCAGSQKPQVYWDGWAKKMRVRCVP